jgi:predicted dehydrogenase
LVAIIDKNADKAFGAGNKWRCLAYTDWQSIPSQTDIIIIATPTDTHYDILKFIPQLEPKIVIAEKPFTHNYKHAKIISELYQRSDIPLAINYTRRYVPTYMKVKKMIQDERFGKSTSCQLIYNRGLKREGSHAINLFNYFFGKFKKGYVLRSTSELICDYSKNDPTFAVCLSYEKCPYVFMFPSDGRNFSIFEINIMFEKGQIKFSDHGTKINIYKLKEEEIYDRANTLSDIGNRYDTRLTEGLTYLINNVVDLLDGKSSELLNEKLLCTDKDALAVHEVLTNLGVL